MILIKVLLFIAACNLHMISTVIVTEAGFSVGCAFILVRIVKWLIDRASHHENQLHGGGTFQLAIVGTISAFSV